MDYKAFYLRHWKWVWTAIIVVPVLVLAIGCLLWPEVFWEGYLYRHIWGPTVADARDEDLPEGIDEGYTAASTLTYAAMLAVAVVGFWRAFRYLGVRLDGAFMVALVPWIVMGSEVRALEDAGLYDPEGRIVYLFISPFIYLMVGLLVFGLVIAGHLIEARARREGALEGFRWGGLVMLAMVVPTLVVRALAPGEMAVEAAFSPLLLATLGGLAALWWWVRRAGRFSMVMLVMVQGTVLAVSALYYVLRWTLGDPWGISERDLVPEELVLIPALAVVCTGAAAGLYWALSRRWPGARAFLAPVALLLFASHFLDGAATYRGLEVHGYSEKHVLPGLLIDATGTALVMLPLKFLVVTAVVYLLDVAYREDMDRTPVLGWLVKVAVMVLGLAPGMRDILRLAMGV